MNHQEEHRFRWLIAGLGLILIQIQAAAARADDWILPDDRLGSRTAPLLLLSRPDVQADLKLEATQVAEAQKMILELTQRGLQLRGKTGQEAIAGRRAIDEAQLDWLGKNLTGNQLDRLQQLELQWEGPSAILSRETVAEYLKLTSTQRQSLPRIITERRTEKSAPTSVSDEVAYHQKVRGVLSAEQQELWVNLLGRRLQFNSSTIANRTKDPAARQAGFQKHNP